MQVMAVRAPRFACDLRAHADRPALVGDGMLTYAQLDDRVVTRAQQLAGPRRVHVLVPQNVPDFIVEYLACLRSGHVVALATECRVEAMRSRYAHASDLHPELAVLLPTSGSTGNPKVVRLSHRNLEANADSIVGALGLHADDRVLTALPAAYSYGLSVINSTLAVGGTLVLTADSVTEPAFWESARVHGATVLPGVPYTFEMLDRLGDHVLAAVPTLRLLTCAGGRLPPSAVRRWARTGQRQGWGLAVMYGQTEATARMAVLRPAEALQFPESVGMPVPGGGFEIRGAGDDGVGEIVYTGPNVMMGYATDAGDLALGATIEELGTGDRGRLVDGRLYITGRRARFAKVRGLRIDLDDVERALEPDVAVCVELPNGLGIVADRPADLVRLTVMAATGLGCAAVRVIEAPVPRLDNGKVDRAAVPEMFAAVDERELHGSRTDRLLAAYRRLLGVPVRSSDSFRGLGGDSMSYVAVSIEVERILGFLPQQWHEQSIDALADESTGGRGLETSVLLRAVAILLVLGSHAAVIDIRGGAHLLMALVGFNFARFQIGRSLAAMSASIAWMLVPAVVWVGLVVNWTWQPYSGSALGLTWITQPTTDGPDWRYWFVGALLWILPLAVIALRVPRLARWRSRWPFGWAVTATSAGFGLALLVVPDGRPSSLFSPWAVLWVFLLGWSVWEARTDRQRIVVSVLAIVLVLATFSQTRLWVIGAGLLVLIWVPRVRLPAPVARAAAALAQASLFIYLVHWQVLDLTRNWSAVGLSLLAGLALTWLWSWVVPVVRRIRLRAPAEKPQYATT
jgi:hypothetical protein